MWIPKVLLVASVWGAYVVSTMWSLLIARRLERSKRFRGRTTTGFIASALSVAALVLGLGSSAVLGIPTPDAADAEAQDVGATGLLMALSAGVRSLSARGRVLTGQAAERGLLQRCVASAEQLPPK